MFKSIAIKTGLLFVFALTMVACNASEIADQTALEESADETPQNTATMEVESQAESDENSNNTKDSGDDETAEYWPTNGWQTAAPEDHGLDPAKLGAILEEIEAKELVIDCVLVVRDGYIVFEEYRDPFGPDDRGEIFSVTKSYISALVGIAIEQGHIEGIDQHVLDLFPNREIDNVDARKEAMTLEHVLEMGSGLDWDDGQMFEEGWWETSDWVQRLLDRPMIEEPGTRYNYCTACSHMLSALIEDKTGVKTAEFAQANLFDPLGIEDVPWGTGPEGVNTGGWGIQLTPRELAKFGYLYLNEGEWDGQQLVPAEWVRESTKEQIVADFDQHYGYHWAIQPLPVANYSATGASGQFIMVLPELDMVVVFTGSHENLDVAIELRELIGNNILPAVVE